MKTAMILAAGRGERLRPFTDQLPKPLIPLADKPIIVHLIERLAHANITNIIINISYRAEQIKNTLGSGKALGVTIHYTEEPEALETGGGIINALPLLGQHPFIVISGDIFTHYSFANLYLRPQSLGHLVLVPNPTWHPQGDFGLDSNQLLTANPQYTYANIGLLHPDFFRDCQPGKQRLSALLYRMIERRRMTGETYFGTWFNIGNHANLIQAQCFCKTLTKKTSTYTLKIK